MSDVGGTAERIERLEARVEELDAALAGWERTAALPAAGSDAEALDATCPEGVGAQLRRESGSTWARVFCDECGTVREV